MILLAEAQHFVRPPDWTWYIIPYFFLAGLAGGCYAIATMFRLWGERQDEDVARLGYYIAFPVFLVCPILLTLDLGQPQRFWHMLVNTTPNGQGLNFKWWSPMSLGSWALVIFGLFATVSFIEVLVRDRVIRLGLTDWLVRPLDGVLGRIWNAVGGLLGTFVAGYTGVLLAVSNQPVWSDTWTLGGLFLASALCGSVALLTFAIRYRPAAQVSAGVLLLCERLFSLLELALIVLFVLTLIPAGTLDDAFGFPWFLLWLVAFAGLVPGLRGLVTNRLAVTGEGAVVAQPGGAETAAGSSLASVAVPGLILLGVLALRAAVILSAQ
jgi:formate-dependent nitrite reductase membrane component NrfD